MVPMTKWVCTDPDDYQWMRKSVELVNGETMYEMHQVIGENYITELPWFAGGGCFFIGDYDKADLFNAMQTFGYEPQDMDDDLLAECLFECQWADFGLEMFATEQEAREYVDKRIGA